MLGNSGTDRCQLEYRHVPSPGWCYHQWYRTITLTSWVPPRHSHSGSFLSSCWFIAWQYLPTSFLYDLAFPSSMNLLWAWQCGFLWRRLEYKYGFLCLELLFLLIQKLPEGDADWTSCHLKSAFHIFVFVGRRRFHTSESFSNTRCAIYHLHNHMAGWGVGGGRKTLWEYFSLWNWFCRGCRIAYFHPVSLGEIAHIPVSSLSSLSEFTWSHISAPRCVCMSVFPPASPVFFTWHCLRKWATM